MKLDYKKWIFRITVAPVVLASTIRSTVDGDNFQTRLGNLKHDVKLYKALINGEVELEEIK